MNDAKGRGVDAGPNLYRTSTHVALLGIKAEAG
jgi:hypothetical protein